VNDWQEELIRVYLLICEHFDTTLVLQAQRMSNNYRPACTDQEVLTIYLFGLMQQRRSLSEIHRYCRMHLNDWFPKLPGYVSFVNRLNRLTSTFAVLIEELQPLFTAFDAAPRVHLVDALPIMLAKATRSDRARVANHLACKGYCSSKATWYYGVKLHVAARRRPTHLPLPEVVSLTSAAEHDLAGFELMLPLIAGSDVYADKAYKMYAHNEELSRQLFARQHTRVYTPVQRAQGQQRLDYLEQVYSTSVSRVRQPIESLFNWIEQKTAIQTASRVRSTKGLLVHVFGRLAAAMILLLFNS
jgi:Transposase DDE domain